MKYKIVCDRSSDNTRQLPEIASSMSAVTVFPITLETFGPMVIEMAGSGGTPKQFYNSGASVILQLQQKKS